MNEEIRNYLKIDETVIDSKGQLAVETVKVIEIGNKFIKDIESI